MHSNIVVSRLLVVDDDPNNIRLLANLFDDSYDILFATNGKKALEIALQERPDLILLDVMMPEMDGMEAMRAIRKIPNLKNLPIVAVTAQAMKGDREKCMEAGAWDYLSKPVDTMQMLSVLRAWLHR